MHGSIYVYLQKLHTMAQLSEYIAAEVRAAQTSTTGQCQSERLRERDREREGQRRERERESERERDVNSSNSQSLPAMTLKFAMCPFYMYI